MAEAPEEEKTEEAAPPAPPGLGARLGALVKAGAGSLLRVTLKLLLMLFVLALPLALAAYPAYLLGGRLLEYPAAKMIEAKLTDIDVRQVEQGQDQTALFEARKHYDVVFGFDGPGDKKYAAVMEMSWPSPGLRRHLEKQYPIGDDLTLYLMPNQNILLADEVAKDTIYRLSGLMGLVFLATGLFVLLWKRLSARMPARVLHFPAATAKSLMIAQSVSLGLSGLLAVALTFSPMMPIPAEYYLAAYWGLALLLTLLLRLLVISDPTPAPAAQEVPPDDKRKAAPAAPPRR